MVLCLLLSGPYTAAQYPAPGPPVAQEAAVETAPSHSRHPWLERAVVLRQKQRRVSTGGYAPRFFPRSSARTAKLFSEPLTAQNHSIVRSIVRSTPRSSR